MSTSKESQSLVQASGNTTSHKKDLLTCTYPMQNRGEAEEFVMPKLTWASRTGWSLDPPQILVLVNNLRISHALPVGNAGICLGRTPDYFLSQTLVLRFHWSPEGTRGLSRTRHPQLPGEHEADQLNCPRSRTGSRKANLASSPGWGLALHRSTDTTGTFWRTDDPRVRTAAYRAITWFYSLIRNEKEPSAVVWRRHKGRERGKGEQREKERER